MVLVRIRPNLHIFDDFDSDVFIRAKEDYDLKPRFLRSHKVKNALLAGDIQLIRAGEKVEFFIKGHLVEIEAGKDYALIHEDGKEIKKPLNLEVGGKVIINANISDSHQPTPIHPPASVEKKLEEVNLFK